ncbi:RNA 2'-phosphotransferase [Fibrella sp. WM1]|uniref:RNA 2'-phosphotransferase n=1 Tax=Fibrella musci TaxID=3242485 RepID=UPI00351F8A9C
MLFDKETTRLSKLLSLALRHQPEALGITLDENGWTDVPVLLIQLHRQGYAIDLDQLRYVVETNNKKRFALSPDETRIRANQGHSVDVDLGYTQKQPPQFLYHGTATRFLEAILTDGLKKMNRHHVHLSVDKQTAINVGSRHGKPVVLVVRAGDMVAAGHIFYQSENGVWLTDYVPAMYLSHD